MMTKVARAMVPAAPPEVLCCSCACRRVYLSFEQSFLFSMVCKTLKFVLLIRFVPLEGLCYLFSMFSYLLYVFWTHLFALWFRHCGMPEQ